MKGAVLVGGREVELQEFEDPTPGPGEVIIEMKASGLCGSDLRPYRAEKGSDATATIGLGKRTGPIIAGHEPCGIVAARGSMVSEEEAPIGRRVIIYHYSGCGHCRLCRTGYAQMCVHGSTVYGATAHGGHAPFLKVPASTLVTLPDELSFEDGAAISCGTGTAYAALVRANISGRDTIAVFGQGAVGLSATMLGTAMGARVIAIDLAPDRLALAREYGAAETIDGRLDDVPAAVRELTHGRGADATFDCTGAPIPRVNAIRSACAWGRMAFVGEGNETTIDISRDILRKQLTLYGTWTFSIMEMEECAQFIAQRQVPLHKMITDRYTLDQIGQGYRDLDTQTGGKKVVVF